MAFDPTLAAIRFGMGLSPVQPMPESVGAMLEMLAGPDHAAASVPIAPFAAMTPSLADLTQITRDRKAAIGTDQEKVADDAMRAMLTTGRDSARENLLRTVTRGVITADGLRERLVAFWADHFTVRARNNHGFHAVTPYVEEAIRPHITGSFADMLRVAVTHPMMLLYLQQAASHGPNSRLGIRRGRGINENLARELMELHALGVDGGYSQADVTELAELLTGLTYHPLIDQSFEAARAEPGAETVLGVTYSAEAELSNVHRALDNLANHPATARHIAKKLAVHFVADQPDAALVLALEDTFLSTQGDLSAMIRTMLEHPAAWAPEKQKVKTPFEYITAGLRALGLTADQILAFDDRTYRRTIHGPLRVMGQPWERPVGPDGWPEAPDDWIIPQAMAARITWAMQLPVRLVDPLPDPREFARTALGDHLTDDVAFAANAAASRRDGVGIVLASAAFQRR